MQDILKDKFRQYMNDRTQIKKLSESVHLRLKIARKARGYKNRSLFAHACGAAVTTYRAHERGDYETKASDIIRYAFGLDVSFQWLLTGLGHPLDHQVSPDPDILAHFIYHLRVEDNKATLKQEAAKEVITLLQHYHKGS